MKNFQRGALLSVLLALCAACQPAPTTSESGLPVLNVNVDQLTVSGLSSGAYMAHHFHLAHSDRVHGAGLLAGGPYDCARNSLGLALNECMGEPATPVSVDVLLELAHKRAEERDIAALGNLQQHNVWLWRGELDSTIGADVFAGLVSFYQQLMPADSVTVTRSEDVHHVFPTAGERTDACQQSEPPYVAACDFDAAGELLTALYGELNPPAETTTGVMLSFEQQVAAGDMAKTLADEGYVYVPDECLAGESCSVHISFHGCNQQAEAVGQAYIEGVGLNQWADTNRLIVLYPQTKASAIAPMNPQACWDWWGYTDEHYATNRGQQIEAVLRMVKRMAGIDLGLN